MSDAPETPPKKIGSLRDRIAAFEQKPAAPAPGPAPGSRPLRQWKPKPVDPPPAGAPAPAAHTPSPPAGGAHISPIEPGQQSPTQTERKTSGVHSGMSASDARESIQRAGGSLKERMAALQGKGAFGPTGAPAPPMPAPKPREWKKPVVVSPPAAVEGEQKHAAEGEHAGASPVSPPAAEAGHAEHEPSASPVATPHEETEPSTVEHAVSPPLAAEHPEGEAEAEEEPHEKTEEDQEAERRAAIAARMARLGGARLGMAPMFGGPKPKPAPKPVVHSPEPEEQEKHEEEHHERIAVLPLLPKVVSPPVHEAEAAPEAPAGEMKAETDDVHPAAASPVVSPAHEEGQEPTTVSEHEPSTDAPAPPPRQHVAMPIPAAPRRAAPPRRNRAPPAAPATEAEDTLLDTDQVAVAEAEGVKEDLLGAKEVEGPQLGPNEEALVEPHGAAIESAEPHAQEAVLVEEVAHEKEEIIAPSTVETHEEPSTAAEGVIHEEEHKAEDAAEAEPVHHEEMTIAEPAPMFAPKVEQVHEEEHEHITEEPIETEASPIPTHDEPDEEAEAEEEENEESARRALVAERMKKLGGVGFGMPVPAFPARSSTMESEKESAIPSTAPEPEVPVLKAADVDVHAPEENAEPEDVVEEEDDDAYEEPEEELEYPEVIQHAKEEKMEAHEEPAEPEQEDDEEEDVAPISAHPSRSLPPPPPPPRATEVPQVAADEPDFEVEEDEFPPTHDVIEDRIEEEEEDEDEDEVFHDADAPEPEPVEEPVPSMSARPARRSLPPPPPPPVAAVEPDHEEEHEHEVEEKEEHQKVPEDANEVEVSNVENDAPSLPAGQSRTIVQKPVTEEETVQEATAPPVIALVNSQVLEYDDDEPDPIDPSFYSPPSRQASSGSLPKVSLHSNGTSPAASTGPSAAQSAVVAVESTTAPTGIVTAEAPEPTEEDEEQIRRQTIAARMAKLGGLRFGVPPTMPPKRSAPPPPAEGDASSATIEGLPEPKVEVAEGEQEEVAPSTEESEYARRQAILARLVAGGGRGFGMAPQLAPPAPPPPMQRSVTEDKPVEGEPTTVGPAQNNDATADAEEADEPPPPPPPRPQRAVPPPRTHSLGESVHSLTVQAPSRSLPPVQRPIPAPPDDEDEAGEADDSFEDIAQMEGKEQIQEEEEELPPPPPPRAARTTLPPLPPVDVPPPLPAGRRTSSSTQGSRPPVPHAAPPPPPSRDIPIPQRGGSNHSGFASVDDPHGSPSSSMRSPMSKKDVARERTISPPKSFASPTETSLSQWELPEIPSVSLGLGDTVNSLSSWSEDDTLYQAAQEPAAPPPPPKPVTLPDLDSDDLMALWGSVGTRVLQAASQLADQSKRAVIGDGSGDGFVHAALDMTPVAMKPLAPHVYGYLIFSMSGPQLQRRTSDIMEGDVAVITDAEFKGRKGLVPYHQHVGSAGDPLIGIVHEFEPKNSKIRVLTASQHPNHYPTIESVSYRLEDLKQGAFKVYRIPQA